MSIIVKPLASQDRITRLREEVAQLKEKIAQDLPGVGSAVPVVYSGEMCNKGIGRFGRMTMSDGQFTFHACTSQIDRTTRYVLDDTHYMSPVNAWLRGDSVDTSLFTSRTAPVKEVKTRDWDHGDYEEALLAYFLRIQPVTLINPSFKTLSAANRAAKGGKSCTVYLTAGTRSGFVEGVMSFLGSEDCRLTRVFKFGEYNYLGESAPLQFTSGDLKSNWFRFIPSPYGQKFRPKTMMDSTGLVFFREAASREIYNYLSFECDHVYSPEQVDKWLGLASLRFFLESNFPIPDIPRVNHLKPFHAPLYVDYDGGTWITFETGTYLCRGNFVIDVVGNETYISRRRCAPPPGYEWVPLNTSRGSVVTFATDVPQNLFGLTTTTVTFQEPLVPLQEISYVELDQGCCVFRPNVGEEEFYDLLDSDLVLVKKGGLGFTKIWLSKCGRVFADSQLVPLPVIDLSTGRFSNVKAWKNSYGYFFDSYGLTSSCVVLKSRADLVQLCPYIIPFSGFVDARFETTVVAGGTISVDQTEVDYSRYIKATATTLFEELPTVRQISRHLNQSQMAVCKKLNAAGLILWKADQGTFQYISPINVNCIIDMWVGTSKEKFVHVFSFHYLWDLIRTKFDTIYLPSGFPVQRLVEILLLNDYRAARRPSIDGWQLIVRRNWWR